jgi:hypothetical protein
MEEINRIRYEGFDIIVSREGDRFFAHAEDLLDDWLITVTYEDEEGGVVDWFLSEEAAVSATVNAVNDHLNRVAEDKEKESK